MMATRATLAGLPAARSRSVFGFAIGVEAHRHEGGHVEGIAQKFSPAADEGFARPFPGLAFEGRKAGQAGHLFALHCADLGQKSQHSCGGDGAKAGDGAQNIAMACRGFFLRDPGSDLGIEFGDLAFHLRQTGLGLAYQQGHGPGLGPVAQAGAIFDQRKARDMQVPENKRIFRNRHLRGEIQRCPHPGQNARIQRIGFGPCPGRLGEAACRQRVDFDQGKFLARSGLKGAVTGPRRREHNPCDRLLSQPFSQRTKARCSVVKSRCRPILQPKNVEMGFRDVNANAIVSQGNRMNFSGAIFRTVRTGSPRPKRPVGVWGRGGRCPAWPPGGR